MYETSASSVVHVRQFVRADSVAVAKLFVEGMCSYEAHQNAYNEQYIASCLRDDLADIEAAYLARGGNFWVATMSAPPSSSEPAQQMQDDIIVGMVGLERVRNDSSKGELRRLSVKRDCQALGIGRLLVAHLEQWASTNGIVRVDLSTGVEMRDAIAFYSKLGYRFEREEPESDEYILACFSKVLRSPDDATSNPSP